MLSGNVKTINDQTKANDVLPVNAPVSANFSQFETLPRDVLGIVLAYSKNHSTMFNVSQSMRNKVKQLTAANTGLITFEKGETCYVVHGSVCMNGDDGQPRQLTHELMRHSRSQLVSATSYKLAAMVAENKMQKKVIYLQKSERGFNFTLLAPQEVKEHHVNGSYSSRFLNMPVSGEVTAASLPLLDVSSFLSEPLAIKNNNSLCERLVAILAARGLISTYQEPVTVNVFKNKEDAEAYAALMYNPMFKMGPSMAIVHECKMQQTVKVVCQMREITNKYGWRHTGTVKPAQVFPMVSMLKSNLLLQENSYPCDANKEPVQLVDAPAPTATCVVM